jgi:RNA polymerase sigma-70 factor (ECF subfamily)
MDSTDVVSRMLRGERSAFEDVMRWYAPDVLRLAYLLLQDRDEAEDVLQESLLKMIQRLKSGTFHTRNGSIKGFLLTCARNLCIDRLRKKVNFTSSEEELVLLESIPDPGDHPGSKEQSQILQDRLDWALSQLSVQQRTILILFELNGDRYEEIAKALHISMETVRKSLYRTRQRLRALLTPYRGE